MTAGPENLLTARCACVTPHTATGYRNRKYYLSASTRCTRLQTLESECVEAMGLLCHRSTRNGPATR